MTYSRWYDNDYIPSDAEERWGAQQAENRVIRAHEEQQADHDREYLLMRARQQADRVEELEGWDE